MPSHLYIHLPYCRRKCPYCDFVKKVPAPGEIASFLSALEVEIEQVASRVKESPAPVSTLYFGGGTPSLLKAEQVESLISRISRIWGIQEGAEITLETNPGTVDLNQLQLLQHAGINRLSIGAQSFSERKLKSLYRDHTVAEAESCLTDARRAGFKNISLDLIFGVPGETVAEWQEDLKRALSVKPEHVSLYNLEYHEQTPLFRWREAGRVVPLSEDLEWKLYLIAHEFLTDIGYEHYEISNFARPGYRAVHNSIYWQRKPYLGLGPGAHSFDGQRRFHNTENIGEYLRLLAEGKSPAMTDPPLTARSEAEERLSLLLRRAEGLNRRAAEEFLEVSVIQRLWQQAASLPAGLSVTTPEAIRLTASGWFRENSVLLWLFQALDGM